MPTNEKWLAGIKKQAYCGYHDEKVKPILQIIADFLPSSSGIAAADAAKRMDYLSKEGCLHIPYEWDPPPESGLYYDISSFLMIFWQVVFIMAEHTPCEDPKQVKLVEFLEAIRSLPSRKELVHGELCQVWTSDAVLDWAQADTVDFGCPNDEMKQQYDAIAPRLAKKDGFTFEEMCDFWVNISAFLARMLAAGMLDPLKCRSRYATKAMRDGA